MTRKITTLLALAALGAAALPAAVAALPPANAWEIGPVIKGRNYSIGMPAQPDAVRGGGVAFEFPSPDSGHVHAVTYRHGPIAGAREIVLRYRIDAPRGTRFVAQENTSQTATLSLFFQQRGDNWSARGRYETYRWYAPAARQVPLSPGEHTVRIGLDEPWISVWGRTNAQEPEGWRAALANTQSVGFVLGSDVGRGHGVYSTRPARLTVLDFEVR